MFFAREVAITAQVRPLCLCCCGLTLASAVFSLSVRWLRSSIFWYFFFFFAAADRPLHHPHLQGRGEDERRRGRPPPWGMPPRCCLVLPLGHRIALGAKKHCVPTAARLCGQTRLVLRFGTLWATFRLAFQGGVSTVERERDGDWFNIATMLPVAG